MTEVLRHGRRTQIAPNSTRALNDSDAGPGRTCTRSEPARARRAPSELAGDGAPRPGLGSGGERTSAAHAGAVDRR
jgi:hypothetical protein